MYSLTDSPLYREIRSTRTPRNPFRATLFFFLLLLASAAASSIPLYFYLYGVLLLEPSSMDIILSGKPEALNDLMNRILYSEPAVLIQLFCCIIPIVASLLFTYFLMKRHLTTLGFRKKNAVLLSVIGLAVGAALSVLSILVAMLNRSASLLPVENPRVGMIILFLFGFLIQGVEEELLFRGVFFTSLLETQTPFFSIVINSLFFAALHSSNSGIQPLASINILLFGIILSILMLRTGSIWAPMALHAAWNFTEGCILGASVSGMPSLPSFFSTWTNPDMALTNGGAFGPEGGLAVTVILIIAFVALILIPPKKQAAIPNL